jgi:hypothetical protein
MADVFVSYSRRDRIRAEALAAALARYGWSVWWDPEIPIGMSFDEVLEEEIAKARSVVVLWSPASVTSDWVKNEAREAKSRRILIPATIELAKVPMEFRHLQTADLTIWNAGEPHAEFEKLVTGLGRLLGRSTLSGEDGAVGPRNKAASIHPSHAVPRAEPPALSQRAETRRDLKRVSPYQINAGIQRDSSFFGRAEELRHILNRDPANYLIVGGRQLGKSSLLLAIKRHMDKRRDMLCDYISVGLEPIESAIAPRIGLAPDATLAEIIRALRNPVDRRPRWFLLDECDTFIETDSHRAPAFLVLDAMRTLSTEGWCYFILTGVLEAVRYGELRLLRPDPQYRRNAGAWTA